MKALTMVKNDTYYKQGKNMSAIKTVGGGEK